MSDREVVEVAARHLGELARRDASIGDRTTYRVGGRAALLVEVGSQEALDRACEAVERSGIEVLVVGKGSNLLVADAGFAGLAVVLGDAFALVEVEGQVVRAGGAAALPVVARRSVAAGLTGFEWAVGVPGSMGGGVRMNAGGHGADLAASLARVRVRDLRSGEDEVVHVGALDLGYRRSNLAPHHVVVWADLQLAAAERGAGEEAISEIVRWRRSNQPGGQNAGSVFTNPAGDSAGRLVEVAGCKGLRMGTAEVSRKHANFIQADEGGSADDVLALMAEVRARVLEATGVGLSPETHFVGFDNPRVMIEGSG